MYDDPASESAGCAIQPSPPATALEPIAALEPPAIGQDRSPNASVCPFLRAVDEDDTLGRPVETPDPANRCAALHEPVPQSLRQQELVCLTSGHVNCPRYLRGSRSALDAPYERRAGTTDRDAGDPSHRWRCSRSRSSCRSGSSSPTAVSR